jgi:inhibitor of KinA sporulation pathway (predicted exonuclease)
MANQILVVDVEATCWEETDPDSKKYQSEIIQVGAVLVDLVNLRQTLSRSWFVKPTASLVSPFCTNLTGITQEQADSGYTYSQVSNLLIAQFNTPEIPWASYGAYDARMFRQESKRYGVKYPFSPKHINVKTAAAVLMGWTKEYGLSVALSKLGLEFVGRQHDGLDDAKNGADILIYLARKARANPNCR